MTPTAANLVCQFNQYYPVLVPFAVFLPLHSRGGQPFDRAANALHLRTNFAEIEFDASEDTFHTNNGDRSSAASFHKTLPHDDLGQVRPPRDQKQK